jgi:hypothetical protein
MGVSVVSAVTHGVPAKLINCYLKVRFVCAGHHQHENVKVLHPPIDELLLNTLYELNVDGLRPEWGAACKERWSKFCADRYEKVIDLIQ